MTRSSPVARATVGPAEALRRPGVRARGPAWVGARAWVVPRAWEQTRTGARAQAPAEASALVGPAAPTGASAPVAASVVWGASAAVGAGVPLGPELARPEAPSGEVLLLAIRVVVRAVAGVRREGPV